MTMNSPAVKLLIQSGMVPEKTVRQLINWRFLPETSVDLHGSQEVTLENEWESVEEFIANLRKAITDEEGAIRETELDFAGEYEEVTLRIKDGASETMRVFVDKLGRVILPSEPKYGNVESICIHNGSGRLEKEVLKREPRYQGERLASWVYYLEG